MWSRKPIPLSISARGLSGSRSRATRTSVSRLLRLNAALRPEPSVALCVVMPASLVLSRTARRVRNSDSSPGQVMRIEALPPGLAGPGPDLDPLLREGRREGAARRGRMAATKLALLGPGPRAHAGQGRLQEGPLASHLRDECLDGARSRTRGPRGRPPPRRCRARRAGPRSRSLAMSVGRSRGPARAEPGEAVGLREGARRDDAGKARGDIVDLAVLVEVRVGYVEEDVAPASRLGLGGSSRSSAGRDRPAAGVVGRGDDYEGGPLGARWPRARAARGKGPSGARGTAT